jgi:hypothetical protein
VPALALFGFGSRFHYTGKTEYQTREDASRSLSKTRRTFFRSQSKRILVNKQTTPLMDTRRQIQPIDHSEHHRIDGESNKENNMMIIQAGNGTSTDLSPHVKHHSHGAHMNGNGNGGVPHQMHHTNIGNNALETYGIVSLKESKIEAWSMMNKSSNSNGAGGGNGNGHIRNGALSERLKLSLPLDSANNRTLQKTIAKHQSEQPRMAWAEQNLSDE